jgi:hypothetical protein
VQTIRAAPSLINGGLGLEPNWVSRHRLVVTSEDSRDGRMS